MAIVNRLEKVILEYSAEHVKRVTLRDISRATGLAESTLGRIVSGKTTRIDYSTLDKLCAYFDVGVGDLLVYVPDPAAAPDGHDGHESEPEAAPVS